MKIRIQDHSVRFRITLKELEELNRQGRIEARTEMYAADGACEGRFCYGVVKSDPDRPSRCEISANGIFLHLDLSDMQTLNQPSEEGVYLRREVTLPNGEMHRFIAFVEKDRPATHCDKPEAWIYETQGGENPKIRPIGKK